MHKSLFSQPSVSIIQSKMFINSFENKDEDVMKRTFKVWSESNEMKFLIALSSDKDEYEKCRIKSDVKCSFDRTFLPFTV